jgi:hypothetical protein
VVQILSMPLAGSRSISPTFRSRNHCSVGRTSAPGSPNVVSGRFPAIPLREKGKELEIAVPP